MTNHGDDCYFFYYSTCSKGDSCPFRHCEAAMGNETVCNLWQEGRCFRTVCKFRHMEITKNRKEIPCYWENQAAGCQKPHCAFFHERPRYIDGVFVPPNKGPSKNMEQPHEEPALPPAAPLPTAANPQLRGVIKTEGQEPVPSPTHPPVVINPADDDEDEDEEGEDGKVGPSPRKFPKSDDALNFGVSTLEEIRLRKALKASMKRAGYPIQSADTSANREKENIQSFFQPALCEARDEPLDFEEHERPRGSVAQRLGMKMPRTDVQYGDGVPLKKSLAERLGQAVEEHESLVPAQKALKPVKDRLGLHSASQPAETTAESKKAPEQIRIKTLEEIRQEKATKALSQSKDVPSPVAPENNKKPTKGVKRAITVKEQPVSHVKTFSEILQAKRKRQEKQQEPQDKQAEEKTAGKGQCQPAAAAEADPEPVNTGGIRVKTLEEIRREKAARVQAQQSLKAEEKKSPDTEELSAKKPRLLRIKKLPPQSNTTAEKSAAVPEEPVKAQPAAPEAAVANNIKVKTFEEIMREKRLRKQEMEEQANKSAEAEPDQKQTPEATRKRKGPAKAAPSSGSSSPSTTPVPDATLPTQKVPVRKLTPLRSKASSSVNGTTTAGSNQNSSPPEAKVESTTPTPTRQTRASALQGPTAEAPTANKPPNNVKNQPEHSTDTKVRPKLNVKPSVVKPAVQVKPGQKRRGAERSAVAAVKPLNSASTAQEEPLQEASCRDRLVAPSSSADGQQSSIVPCSPNTLLDSGTNSSPLPEDLQTVPIFKQSLSQETKPTVTVAAAREASAVPQSPVMKTPTQPRSRRTSVAGARTTSSSSAAASTSAVDDFEDLISEFTNDPLEDQEVDPGIGEDDLLQELSEMIDS
ncbi:uncharacterized protein V6R79_013884 [Siganus canaliculatus]